MSARRHPWGCTCATHVDRPWGRSEHWSRAEVDYLDRWYGRRSDEAIARHLGRPVLGVRLKAKRLGLRKRTQALTARGVAEIFGVDATVVVKHWIRHGLIRAAPSPTRIAGRTAYWLVAPEEIDRFIRRYPELIDVDKMPASPYRDVAARDPWLSLPDVFSRTGRDQHGVALLIRLGILRGRRRGQCWYLPLSEAARLRPRSRAEIAESTFRRESRLEMRRLRRKRGLAA